MSDKQIKVLLVADDEKDFLLIQDLLDENPTQPYDLSWAPSYEEGLKAILLNGYGIYLIDHGLDNGKGLAFIQAVTERNLNRPFILLSGCNDSGVDRQTIASGAIDFLVKDKLTSDKLDRSIRYTIQLNQTKKALRLSRERLNEAQALAHIGYFDWDVATDKIYWSDEHYRIFGLEPQSERISYERFLEFVDAEDIPKINKSMKFLKQLGDYQSLTYKIVLPGNKVKYLEGKTKAVHNSMGQLTRISGTTQDISIIIEKENRIQQEKRAAETYLEMAGSIILIIDKNEQVTLVNQEGVRILGLPEKEIIGKNWFDHFIASDEREEIRQIFHDILSGNLTQLEFYENAVLSKDGTRRIIRWYNRLLTDMDGHATAAISSGIDITRSKTIERELKDSRAKIEQYANKLEQEVARQTKELVINQAKLKKANQLAKIGYWEINLTKSLQIHWSEEYYQLYEVSEKVPDDDRRYFLQFVHKNDQEGVVEMTRNAIEKAINTTFEFRITTPTQKEKYLRAEIHCQKNQKGVVEKIFSIVQDITDQKKAALQLEQSLQKERDLGKMKSRFVSMASHEFRTPLTSIMASADLITIYNERGDLEKQRKHINRIKGSVRNLTSILNDFLSLEKLESGKIQFMPAPVALVEFIEEVREEVGLIAKMEQQVHHVHNGKAEVSIDQHLVKNILINLLSNAIKYSPNGEDVQLITENGNGRLIIHVKDQGIGIPEEDQEKMFSRFFRATNVTNIKGTGLGLTIVKRYLDLMNGTISFESRPNKGTTFTVEIPLKG